MTSNPSTWGSFLDALYDLVSGRRPISARISEEWYNGQKITQLGPLVNPVAINPRRYSRGNLEKGLRERGITQSSVSQLPVQTVYNKVAATAEQHIIGAGRSAVVDAVSVDDLAVGYMRVGTGLENCAFCNMLIAQSFIHSTKRGALFRNEAAGQKYHDNCDCDAVPVFVGHEEDYPGFAEHLEMRQLWASVTQGLSGNAARQAWRRYWDEKRGRQDVGTTLPVAA